MEPGNIFDHLSRSDAIKNLPPHLQTALFLGALTFVPTALVSLTAYTRIVIVLSFVRKAVTAQEIPPTSVVIGLALFLTFFVMSPTLDEIGLQAISPYLDGQLNGPDAIGKGTAVLRKFMLRQTRRQDLGLFFQLAHVTPPEDPGDTSLRVLVPAFMISEIKTAFIMGLCIYLPFLMVDLVVASVLTAMGMVMMPPVIISSPFKILLFVVADGWTLVTKALSLSFG